MSFRVACRIATASLALCATQTLAGPYEVQMNGHLSGFEHNVDSYEVKCTQSSTYLCVTLEVDPDVEVGMQMAGIATAPSNIVGQAFVRRAAPWDPSATTCLVRPGNPAGIRAFVAVSSSGYVSGDATDYTIKAECAVGGFGADPFEARKTTISRKQDQ